MKLVLIWLKDYVRDAIKKDKKGFWTILIVLALLIGQSLEFFDENPNKEILQKLSKDIQEIKEILKNE